MPEASASHASARRLGCLAAAALLASTASGFAAFAGDSLNSDDKPVNTGDTAEQRQKKDIDHDDFNIVPIVGGSSDIGVGGGYFSNLAHLKTGFDPYVWDIESAGLITFKPGDSGVIVPYTDIYMKLSIPRLFGHPIRLEIRPSFTAESTVFDL